MKDAGMPQKKHRPEEIVAKLRPVEVLVSQGQSVAEPGPPEALKRPSCISMRIPCRAERWLLKLT